jgi:crotonobetainyl-CoA:carnitine CoA-transferase CaiB-like acyl-CoA transferase
VADAFEGVRVLDFTAGTAGPLGCMLLADFGADVIRVGPEAPADPGALCFGRNKRRVDLDPDDPLLRELIASADVAVFDTPDAERAGGPLDSERLLREHPSLLVAALPHWGAPGPWSELPTDDVLLWGMSGAAFAQFSWDAVPVQLVTPQLAYAHGMLGACAIAAALLERAGSGRGQRLEVNGIHALGGLQSGALLRAQAAPQRRGQGARGTLPNYRLYRCADGEWLFLATLIVEHYVKALDAIGLREILELPGVDGRAANVMQPGVAREVRDRMEARFAERDRESWLETLHAHGVPSGPVWTREQWFESETVAANDMRLTLDHPELGPVTLPGVPAKLADTPGRVRHLERAAEPAALLAGAPRSTREPESRTDPPLAGVRVLDLGVIIASPFASAVLANFGADVIKVEPLTGDSFRPFGLGFVGYNQGKRSLCVDLKHPEGRRVFEDLVRSADVVCDNYRLGVLERLGIDHASLAELNPRVISASITAFGSTGALAPDPGFDPLVQARSGLMQAQGGRDEPVFHQIPVNDTASAMVTAFAICAALHARERSGRGQRVETSLACQGVLCQARELTHFEGRAPAARGGRDCVGLGALQRFYACADGWLALSCHTPGQADAALGVTGERADEPLAEAWDGALAARLADAFKGRPRDAWLAELRARGVPAAPVTTLEEMASHPLHEANRFFAEIDDPRFGRLRAVRAFADFERTPGGFPRGAPELGAHGVEILRELGYDDARVEALAECGAIRIESTDA